VKDVSIPVKAAVAWYGQIRPVITKGVRIVGHLDVAARIKAPILGLYGGEDLGNSGCRCKGYGGCSEGRRQDD